MRDSELQWLELDGAGTTGHQSPRVFLGIIFSKAMWLPPTLGAKRGLVHLSLERGL